MLSRRPLLMATLAAAVAAASANVSAAVPDKRRYLSRHRITVRGTPIDYVAQAGDTILRDDRGRPAAGIFAFSYLRQAVSTSDRPVIFIYGGGPGGSSMSDNFLSMGPRYARALEGGGFAMADNSQCLIDAADLVFIDPVSSGFSRVMPGVPERKYWGRHEDVEAFALFVRTWLEEHGRKGSPIYIAGTSYGTIRSALLSHRLHAMDMPLAGVVLNSSVISYISTRFRPGNDLPYINFLPSYAAVHHARVLERKGVDLWEHLRRAEAFAWDDYAPALARGDRLDPGRRDALATEMAALTGLDRDYLIAQGLRVRSEAFMAEYGRSTGLLLERSDGRIEGLNEAARVAAFRDAAPFLETPAGKVVAEHMTRELGIEIDRPYVYIALVGGENWGQGQRDRASAFENVDGAIGLAQDMRANPGLRVMMAAGLYDLATPYFASSNVLSSHGMPRERVIKHFYRSGHGVHRDPEAVIAYQQDLRALMAGAGL